MVLVYICPNCGGDLFYADRTERTYINMTTEEEWTETLREDLIPRCVDCDSVPRTFDVDEELREMLWEVSNKVRLVFVREGEEAFRRAYNQFIATPNDSPYWDEEEEENED